jgi:tRNA dimethylallyltransferase
MIDVVGPEVLYSAGMFADAAGTAIRDIIARGRSPLVVGGSGFYVKALFEGLGAPSVDPAILAALELRLAEEGAEALHAELTALDPTAAAAHSSNNVVKTLRALACYYQTGRPYSSYLSEPPAVAEWTPSYLAIAPERTTLYERIDDRVLAMIDAGLIEETERVLASGVAPDAPGLRTVGYVETVAFLRGETDRATLIASTQQSTRRYAKRQMTWLRRVEGITRVSAPEIELIDAWYRSVLGG